MGVSDMEIIQTHNAQLDQHEIKITIPAGFILRNTEPHPYGHLIDTEQGIGIIKDAVLLSAGLQLIKGDPTLPEPKE